MKYVHMGKREQIARDCNDNSSEMPKSGKAGDDDDDFEKLCMSLRKVK